MQIKQTARMECNLLATATSNETKTLNISKSNHVTKKLTNFLHSAHKYTRRGTKKRPNKNCVKYSTIK